jgi:hypothetical protein
MLWLITDQVCLFVYLLVYVVGWVPVRPLTDYGQVFIAITLPRSDKPTGPRREQSNDLCPTPKSSQANHMLPRTNITPQDHRSEEPICLIFSLIFVIMRKAANYSQLE